jgi:serine phosphatase RsbU (regulator of sigma subunit)
MLNSSEGANVTNAAEEPLDRPSASDDRDAAHQLRRLYRFTADLDSATSPADLEESLFARARQTLGASAGALFEVHDDVLRVTASFGYPDETVRAWRDVPLATPLPACAAVQSGEPVVIETQAEYAERFPMAAGIAGADDGSVVAIPTTYAGRAEGVLGLRFPHERRFEPGDIELMAGAAQQFALARRRLELLEAERAARTEAERAQGRVAFLARASQEIATSLDYERTLAAVARMAVPDLADWCAVDLLDDDGTIRQLAVAHVDPDKVALAIDLRRRYPPDPDAPQGVSAAIRSGRSELMEEIPRELLERAVEGNPELRDLLDELQLRSSMVVPLVLGGESIGAITFVMAESDRRYTPLDLRLAEELAARAAIAIGNARLYEAEHRARVDAEAARRRTQVLVTLGEVLTSSPELRTAAESFARFMAGEVADAATVCLFDRDGIAALTISARAGDDRVWNGDALGIEAIDVDVSEDPVTRALLDREATIGRAPDDAWLPRWLGDDRPWGSAVIAPVTSGERMLGVLVAGRLESSPGFTHDECDAIAGLADRAAQALDNARLYTEQRFIADTLQQSLLPPTPPDIPGYELALAYRPAGDGTQVGGDFYDVFKIDGSWLLVVGDVCGKGSEAAAVMAMSRYAVRTAALRGTRPSDLLATLNESLVRNSPGGRFATAALARISTARNGHVTVCVAGHPPPFVVRAGGAVETLGEPGSLLGVFPDPTLHDVVTSLDPGDSLVLYTDGITDARGGDQQFGVDRLRETLGSAAGSPPDEVVAQVMDAVVAFSSGTLADDIALMAIRAAAGGRAA